MSSAGEAGGTGGAGGDYYAYNGGFSVVEAVFMAGVATIQLMELMIMEMTDRIQQDIDRANNLRDQVNAAEALEDAFAVNTDPTVGSSTGTGIGSAKPDEEVAYGSVQNADGSYTLVDEYGNVYLSDNDTLDTDDELVGNASQGDVAFTVEGEDGIVTTVLVSAGDDGSYNITVGSDSASEVNDFTLSFDTSEDSEDKDEETTAKIDQNANKTIDEFIAELKDSGFAADSMSLDKQINHYVPDEQNGGYGQEGIEDLSVRTDGLGVYIYRDGDGNRMSAEEGLNLIGDDLYNFFYTLYAAEDPSTAATKAEEKMVELGYVKEGDSWIFSGSVDNAMDFLLDGLGEIFGEDFTLADIHSGSWLEVVETWKESAEVEQEDLVGQNSIDMLYLQKYISMLVFMISLVSNIMDTLFKEGYQTVARNM